MKIRLGTMSHSGLKIKASFHINNKEYFKVVLHKYLLFVLLCVYKIVYNTFYNSCWFFTSHI